MMKKTFRKGIFGFVFSMLLLFSQSANAQSVEQILIGIWWDTYYILADVDSFSKDLEGMAHSWIQKTDDNQVISTLQAPFTDLEYANNITLGKQITMGSDLTRNFLTMGSINPDSPALPVNANDLSFVTLLGSPLNSQNCSVLDYACMNQQTQQMAASYKNYLQNASGSSLIIDQPNPRWSKSSTNAKQYLAYYNTVASIQSFNSYVLSSLYYRQYMDKAATDLAAKSSTQAWFSAIGTEDLGLVLRHILMYDSQIYVELNRLERLQQQQLASMAMTNTLLIIGMHSMAGSQLYARATDAM